METLSELHFDALGEIINIATGRAAQGLGEIIGERIQSSVPTVQLIQLADVNPETLRLKDETFGFVTQNSTGAMNAEVMLLFAETDVLSIVRKMMGAEIDLDTVREFEKDAMCELGNIMINACLSSIADMLHLAMESSLPRYAVKTREEIVNYVKNDVAQDFVLASHIDLTIEGKPTEGKLFILINSSALGNVTDEIDRLSLA